MASRRERGFSLVDGLVATTIMAVAVTGAFVAWAVMFRHAAASRLVGQAAQLARAEVERARVFGADGLPYGAFDAATTTATWTGCFDSTAGAWATGGVAYFDAFGNRVANASSAGAALSMQATMTDTNILANATGYSLQPASRRKFAVSVTTLADGSALYGAATYLVEGGL